MTSLALLKRRLQNNLSFIDLHPRSDDMAREVLAGLLNKQKCLSPKFFYDDTGRQLFNEICQLPEYYLTRSGMEILREYGKEISVALGTDASIVEYGSGDPDKAALLLSALQKPRRYVSIDIAKPHLLRSCEILAERFPELEVTGLCADFNHELFLNQLLSRESAEETAHFIAFFPGSSIGNFTPEEALIFLRKIAQDLGPKAQLLIAVDLVKSPNQLHMAYNDARGITARFNKNILLHLNREMKTTFDVSQFEHYAFFNPAAHRIEMHLVSSSHQRVIVAGQMITFERGESIHTENSYKYSPRDFEDLLARAGFFPRKSWRDSQDYFTYYLCAQEV